DVQVRTVDFNFSIGSHSRQVHLRHLGAQCRRPRFGFGCDIERHTETLDLNACCRDLSDLKGQPVHRVAVESGTAQEGAYQRDRWLRTRVLIAWWPLASDGFHSNRSVPAWI